MTTNPLTLAAVRAIKEEAENLIGNEGVVSPYVIKRTTEAIPALCDSYITLVEALRLLHDERVHFHMEDAGHNNEKQECCFCTFGDRAENDIIECSYCKVKAILATIDPQSGEAQTEGDGG